MKERRNEFLSNYHKKRNEMRMEDFKIPAAIEEDERKRERNSFFMSRCDMVWLLQFILTFFLLFISHFFFSSRIIFIDNFQLMITLLTMVSLNLI
jgi:hypothetical protein